ncbi:hypothetical protein AX15_000366 [Amanita polypyramis BW_CC]|nr:hypothetical protein AX15_000366 [Amanita polypyramis BW_CC]
MQRSPTELEPSFLFAPNVTPGTFMKTEEVEPLELPQSDSMLFPCPDDLSQCRRPGHGRRKPEDHIPRPPNAFILFRSSFIRGQHVSPEVETDHSTLSKIIGLTWQNLPEKERQVWHEKARVAKEEHRRRFPGYTFRPNMKGRNGKTGRRTVREVFPKDVKRCAKIAELLVKGKKGEELDVAMQEFDKYHKVEIVTKFEEPITAQQFARSSSVPAPGRDGEYRLSKRARSSNASRELSAQLVVPHFVAPVPPSLRLSFDDSYDSYSLDAPSSPADCENVHTPLSCTSTNFYGPPSPLDDQLLGFIRPVFHPSTEPSTPDHLMGIMSFTHINTWPACSSPCSDAPTTPLQGMPLEYSLPFQHMGASPADYYDTTQFPSFDVPPTTKEFVNLSQHVNHYYDTNDLIPFSGQTQSNDRLPSTAFDFNYSSLL